MGGHHLILGELIDFITGETLEDTHDQRYRQKIARLLVNQHGYLKDDIEPRKKLLVQADDKKAIVKIDFIIKLAQKVCMVIKYGPGSLVTRRRPILAASRLVVPYQVPVAVVTNGENAEVLEGATGAIMAQGLKSIPSKSELANLVANAQFAPISETRAELESRIIYCYEVDGSCLCNGDICRL